ncbi:MAG TPA: DUF4142 domain-containing protein [Burkholderiales bacterium]
MKPAKAAPGVLALVMVAALGACAPLVSPERAATRDAELVRSIVQANLAAIAAGRLAVSRARSREVRQHGQRMVKAHTLLQAEASELKSARGVPLPTRPDAEQEAALRKLERLPRAEFDRAYLELARKEQEARVQLLRRAASRANDPALRAYAERAAAR